MGTRTTRWTVAVAVAATALVFSTAVPAASAIRIRIYRGETSQPNPITFGVVKLDAGRYVSEIGFPHITQTCEDGSTLDYGMWMGWGPRGLKLGDGVTLSLDWPGGNSTSEAFHLHGRIGQHQGSGTLTITDAVLTADEQAQTCTTGELTWTVEYARTRIRGRGGLAPDPGLDARIVVHVARDGEVSRTTVST